MSSLEKTLMDSAFASTNQDFELQFNSLSLQRKTCALTCAANQIVSLHCRKFLTLKWDVLRLYLEGGNTHIYVNNCQGKHPILKKQDTRNMVHIKYLLSPESWKYLHLKRRTRRSVICCVVAFVKRRRVCQEMYNYSVPGKTVKHSGN